jgi:hypothetical protein
VSKGVCPVRKGVELLGGGDEPGAVGQAQRPGSVGPTCATCWRASTCIRATGSMNCWRIAGGRTDNDGSDHPGRDGPSRPRRQRHEPGTEGATWLTRSSLNSPTCSPRSLRATHGGQRAATGGALAHPAGDVPRDETKRPCVADGNGGCAGNVLAAVDGSRASTRDCQATS